MKLPLVVQLVAVLSAGLVSAELSEEECRTPPSDWPQRPPKCCDDLPYPTEEMKKIFASCVNNFQGKEPKPEERGLEDPRLCIEECVYKELGFVGSEGKSLSTDVVGKRIGKKVAAPWTSVMQAAVTACSNVTAYSGENAPTCSTLPHEHTHCVSRHLFLNCPKDLWTDNAECKVVKKRMQECPGIPPPPPPPPEGLPEGSA